MGTLTGKEECESASIYLDLYDNSAEVLQANGRPYGCIYASNDWLSWYDPNDSPYESSLCGGNDGNNGYDCICTILGKYLSNTIEFMIVFFIR